MRLFCSVVEDSWSDTGKIQALRCPAVRTPYVICEAASRGWRSASVSRCADGFGNGRGDVELEIGADVQQIAAVQRAPRRIVIHRLGGDGDDVAVGQVRQAGFNVPARWSY